jgi:hypothetical protein
MGIFLGDRPVSVYFNGASASLPVQGVFLGPVQVFPTGTAAAILYFYYDPDDEEADNAWTKVGNWWLDAEHTEPAGRLPTSDESVVASETVVASGQTVVNFTMNDPESLNPALAGTLTVTGMATFNGNSANNGTVTGNATFNDSSYNTGNVTGTATFNDSACNDGGTAGTFVPATPPECNGE